MQNLRVNITEISGQVIIKPLHEIAENLERDGDGVWRTDIHEEISYPLDGHDILFGIEDNSFWFRHRNTCIIEIMTHYPPGEFILDIGGGNGFVSKGIQDQGYDVVLLEPGIEGIWNAKKRGVINIIHGTLESVNFMKQSIPSIGLFDVLEHIQDDISFLKQIHQLLKDNGRLYITVPAYNFLFSSEDKHAGHFRRYTRKELCRKLRSAGYCIEYDSYFFHFLPFCIVLFRIIPDYLGKKEKNVNDVKRAHENKKGIAGSIMNGLLHWELNMIRKKRRIPFGGSCLIVASKTSAR